MLTSRTLIVLTALAASVSLQVWAQQSPSTATPGPATDTTPPGLVATTNNPNLSVATVRLENGTRASRIIGMPVHVDGDEKVGSVDDLIMTDGNKVTVAVVAVGGVLGLGAKLVALPYQQLRLDADKVVLPGVTKEALNAMPSFVY